MNLMECIVQNKMKKSNIGIILLSSLSMAVLPANASLISSWNLNGDYSDSTGNGHAGAGFGSNFLVDSPSNSNLQSANFNNSSYVALNQSFSGVGSLSEFSASAWFKTTATGNNWSLLDFDRSDFFNMVVTGRGGIAFSTSTGIIHDMFSLKTGLNDGNWHHVAVTYGAATGKTIYIDGAADSSTSYNGALGTFRTRFGFIGDGSEASSFNGKRNGLYYDGLISEVKLWDESISEQAVSAQAVRAKVPEPSTLAIFALGMIGLASRRLKKQS
ncbi:hypothetical protein CXF79_00060 [Colwellia sp. Bg11-28]|nr:hypothetical protein CXF79_00060 [Colwellia sp. Bg11-28]